MLPPEIKETRIWWKFRATIDMPHAFAALSRIGPFPGFTFELAPFSMTMDPRERTVSHNTFNLLAFVALVNRRSCDGY
jgi:hypothetical protein